MVQVAGIKVERSSKGELMYGRVDFRKHPDMIHIFEAKGIEVEKKSPSKCPRGYLTHDEFWKVAKEEIDNICVEYGIL